MEIGGGPYAPLGVSTVMYLNGAESATTIDVARASTQRTAEALYDLLAACALEPSKWNMKGIPQDEFLGKIYQFNIQALRNGDLFTGIENTRLRYLLGSLENLPFSDGRFSIISSRATLEHVINFSQGMRELSRVMKPGGVAYHSVDLTDHRIYRDQDTYNMWSFLTESENPIAGWCNRLRPNELIRLAAEAGFVVNVFGTIRNTFPEELYPSLKPPYSEMDPSELEVTSLSFVMIKN